MGQDGLASQLDSLGQVMHNGNGPMGPSYYKISSVGRLGVSSSDLATSTATRWQT